MRDESEPIVRRLSVSRYTPTWLQADYGGTEQGEGSVQESTEGVEESKGGVEESKGGLVGESYQENSVRAAAASEKVARPRVAKVRNRNVGIRRSDYRGDERDSEGGGLSAGDGSGEEREGDTGKVILLGYGLGRRVVYL